jgi:uncharacterized protein
VAENIFKCRNENGVFTQETPLESTSFGRKGYDSFLGFRIRDAKNPFGTIPLFILETYKIIVEKMAKDEGVSLQNLMGNRRFFKKIDLEKNIIPIRLD